jgi:hypothetical protein
MSRRSSRTTSPVPVVLPLVEVWIDSTGGLAVSVDREPCYIPANVVPAGRPALGRILEENTSRLASPVRVELHEADGAVFTDIVTPRPPTPLPSAPDDLPTDLRPREHPGGFTPGEQVAVAVVITHAAADDTGSAQVRLPVALMRKYRGAVLLVGRTSGAVAFPAGTSATVEASGTAGVA